MWWMQGLTSNPAHERHTNGEESAEEAPGQPVISIKVVGIATFGFIRSIVIGAVVHVRWINVLVMIDVGFLDMIPVHLGLDVVVYDPCG